MHAPFSVHSLRVFTLVYIIMLDEPGYSNLGTVGTLRVGEPEDDNSRLFNMCFSEDLTNSEKLGNIQKH